MRVSCKKQPELWKNKPCILHQDKTPALNALSGKHYLATKGTPVFEHTPYSADLVPCDFFLFSKIKSTLQGSQFKSMEEVKQKLAELLNALTKEDFQHCSDQWKKMNGLVWGYRWKKLVFAWTCSLYSWSFEKSGFLNCSLLFCILLVPANKNLFCFTILALQQLCLSGLWHSMKEKREESRIRH